MLTHKKNLLKFKDLSLKSKIILLVTFIGSVALVLAISIFIYLDYGHYKYTQLKELASYANVIGTNNAAAVFFEDKFNAHENLKAMAKAQNVRKTIIYTINKRTNLLHTFAIFPEKTENIEFDFPLYVGMDSAWIDNQIVNVIKPILFKSINGKDEDIIGGIYIQTKLPINQRIIRYIKIFFLILGLSSIFAFLLTLRLQRYITQPIFSLQTLVKRVKEENDYSLRSQVDAKDEVGELSSGVNRMLEHIEIQNIELVRAKEEAIELLKVKEQFLANMSHEIRTPMNAILGMTNILMDTNIKVEQLKYLKNIKVSSENLLVIINDILDFSKIKSGNIKLEKIIFSLTAIVKQVFNTLQFSADNRGIDLNYIIEDNVPTHLIGDQVRLNQILMNIIGNGIKFTESGSVKLHVTIQKQLNEDDVILSFKIMDTGIGIKKEKLKTIFESFQQESLETTRKYGGTGLGLSISKQLIELQKGQITVQSKVNEGSIFNVLLPYTISHKVPIYEGNKISKSMLEQVAEMNILLVEDNPLNQLVATQVLKKYNINFQVADDGESALDFLKKQKFDALLLDLHMPKRDGFSVARYIRKEGKENKNIIIIALTAAATQSEINKCFDAGMDNFISKPFKEEDLIHSLLTHAAKNTSSINIPEIDTNKHVTDLTYLKTMSNGNMKIIKEMVEMFKEQIPIYINELKTSLVKKDYHSLSENAHKIKSSLNIVGMNNLATIMKQLELKAKKQEDKENYELLITEFVKAVNIGIIELDNKIELME